MRIITFRADDRSAATAAAQANDQRVETALATFQRRLGWAGALLIRNVPFSVSFDEASDDRPGGQAVDAYLAAVTARLGEIIAFADWHEGKAIQDIVPIETRALTQNANNRVRLEWHTETAFRPDTPDGLCLACLRGDPAGQAETLLADFRRVFEGLDHDERAYAASPRYFFVDERGERATDGFALLTQERRGPRFNYAEALRAEDPFGGRLLVKILKGIEDLAISVDLTAGDLLVIDNRHMVHSRSAYAPSYGRGDRWVKRSLFRARAEPWS